MQTPANWKYAGTEESRKNLKEIRFTDDQLKRVAASNNGIISQITLYKYSTDSVSGFIPTVKLTVRLNPAANFGEFKAIITASTDRLKSAFDDFKYIDKVSTTRISNHDFVYSAFSFSITGAHSAKFVVRARSYDIPRWKYWFSISMMDNSTTEDCSAIYNEILKTIAITD
jgi:hypothetical protein